MHATPLSPWTCSEAGFETQDKTRLFYRTWEPNAPRALAEGGPRALIFLHRGHEHSGRIQALVEQLGYTQDWAFAWDARGHGHSPGERGDAPGFSTLVQDFDDFVRHLQAHHGIAPHNTLVVANSVGAVLAATWLHDYAPTVRGVVMAAAAFEINLYVPLAKPALRLALGFKKDLFVTSYIRSGMLTHDSAQAQGYDADSLITKNISARVLLDLADTARRVVADASAIDTPILMLVADQDYVVKQGPQKRFFEQLASGLKRMVLLKNCRHAIFYESDAVREQALQEARSFIDACFAQSPLTATRWHTADAYGASARRYQALQRDEIGPWPVRAFYATQRAMLASLGRLSKGMRIGLAQGFDSGASLDYVYGNQPQGDWGLGKVIDGGYLGAIGWRGIRLRRWHIQEALGRLIAQHPTTQPLRILDIAAGGGRYVLETVKRFQERDIHVTLRDFEPGNLEQARQLAEQLQLQRMPALQQRDAFDEASYADDERYDIVIISGLYELFNDNAAVLRSLRGVARQLLPGGHLVYTGQPWHPQLVLIAKTLNNHRGQPWVMRPRPQAELDALVASAGCRKVATRIGLEGIFTVSVARHEPVQA
ncbi:bifunctional alpha/beta hydrolase/class I SAM-dependent methyltransferase [uncultured Rhodoferax sp.]|uniref:bifunctional alpha/beta hydrolase/class I SAM-dependent methyltransferase n=1 Tax=uncultured Rhodoferax sp. TaxID=223188 RepID=UPI0025E72F33|nr:bifunctional alpha/beta hydrolase/class I SAM-dependent methyltransferase [uncultured Rhodoferax sp.]